MFQMRTETKLLIALLDKTDGFISYDDLSAAAGIDVRAQAGGGGYGYLQSARRHLENHKQIYFGPVRGEGLERLQDGRCVDAVEGQITAARKRTRRALIISTCTKVDDLPPEERNRLVAYQCIGGMIEQALKPKKLQEVIDRTPEDGRMTRQELLEFYGGTSNGKQGDQSSPGKS